MNPLNIPWSLCLGFCIYLGGGNVWILFHFFTFQILLNTLWSGSVSKTLWKLLYRTSSSTFLLLNTAGGSQALPLCWPCATRSAGDTPSPCPQLCLSWFSYLWLLLFNCSMLCSSLKYHGSLGVLSQALFLLILYTLSTTSATPLAAVITYLWMLAA